MIQQILKQAFPPALRLWLLRAVLSSPEDVLAFRPLIQELLLEAEWEEQAFCVPELAQVFAQWALAGQWKPLIHAVETLMQFLPEKEREPILRVLREQWPDELVFSPQGFLYYKEKPVLRYLAEEAPFAEARPIEETHPVVLPVLNEDTRKVAFQKIRQQRLRLLKDWKNV